MFYCDDCAIPREWPITMFRSKGQCEICETAQVCNDMPSSRLPIPRTKPDVVDEEPVISTALRFSKPSDAGPIVAWVDVNGGRCLIDLDNGLFTVEGVTVHVGEWVVHYEGGPFAVLTDEELLAQGMLGLPA